MNDINMKIWNKVSRTDPSHTKKVSFGREFTAIDAHYQVMRATETFGPIGKGWGYHCEHGFHEKLAWCDVTIWWLDGTPEVKNIKEYGPVRGMAEVVNSKGRIDTDAPKKAMTDALTKGLSHLGFSADVFLGMYDDNKYVEELSKEKAKEDMLLKQRMWCDKHIMEIRGKAVTANDVVNYLTELEDKSDKMFPEIKEYWKNAKDVLINEFNEEKANELQ